MTIPGKKVAILLESGFYESEIFYYEHRFREANCEARFVSRLWGQETLTFHSSDYKVPFECHASLEMSDEELDQLSAVIIPGGLVADRLRYTEEFELMAPAVDFLQRAFERKHIMKCIVCHGLSIMTAIPQYLAGRVMTCPNNFFGELKLMKAVYANQDVVIDGDLITARSSDVCGEMVRLLMSHLK